MNIDALNLPGLSTEDLLRVDRPLEDARTMPPAAYTREDVYDIEVERIMRRNWLPVLRVDQVARPGDYVCLTLFDQPVMVVHGHDGEIRVMSRVCLHRAAPVAEGSGNRSLFTCPYHAWSYGTDGQLMRAPMMEGVDGFAEKECRLPQLRTEIWEGFVMVNFDDDAPAFAPQVETLRQYFAPFKFSELVVARTLEFDSGWNWKVLVENFMEAYHHAAVHATTLEPPFHARNSVILDTDGPWALLHMPSEHRSDPADPNGLPPVSGLEDWQAHDLFATAIFPHFLLAIQGNMTAWYQVLPVSAERMILKIHLCVPASTVELPNFDELANGMEEMVSLIHHEDIDTNDDVWRGLKAPLTRQGRLSLYERAIWQFNQWWLGAMANEVRAKEVRAKEVRAELGKNVSEETAS